MFFAQSHGARPSLASPQSTYAQRISCPRNDTKFHEIPCTMISCPRNDTKFHEGMHQFEGHEISAGFSCPFVILRGQFFSRRAAVFHDLDSYKPISQTKHFPYAKISCPRNDTKFHEEMHQFEGHEISASPMTRTTNMFCRSGMIHRVVAMRRSHL